MFVLGILLGFGAGATPFALGMEKQRSDLRKRREELVQEYEQLFQDQNEVKAERARLTQLGAYRGRPS